MTRKRTDFTTQQKAEIFARDAGTCAFSGISVWLLDYGITPNFEVDWADHIAPSAKGGMSELENGICASSFYNAKKKDNGSDNKFLFHHGKITNTYVKVHGKAPESLISDLRRRGQLTTTDWYVNRAIANTLYALEFRCELNINGKEYRRTDQYYFKVAFNFLTKKLKDNAYTSISERKMIRTERPFGVDSLLEIENVETMDEYLEWAESLWSAYSLNWELNNAFLPETNSDRRRELLDDCSNSPLVNPQLSEALGQLLDDDHDLILISVAA